MSSTIEGSDDWAGEDELDLGQEDEVQAPNGVADHGDSPTNGGPIGDGEEDSSVLHGPDAPATPKRTLQPGESPHPQTGFTFGSPDETASTPDDTPSLHVSMALWYLFDTC